MLLLHVERVAVDGADYCMICKGRSGKRKRNERSVVHHKRLNESIGYETCGIDVKYVLIAEDQSEPAKR
jgi:hypothetical protein